MTWRKFNRRAGTALAKRRWPMQCLHCHSAMAANAEFAPFCCAGCQTVYTLIRDEGLTRFYALAGDKVAPATRVEKDRPLAWLEPLLERAQQQSGDVCSLSLDVQGIQCAACVWLMNELFRRSEGGVRLVVNPGIGRMELAWRRGAFDVPAFVHRVESFGYLLGPALKKQAADGLTWRLGVCAALTLNVMLFSVSFYFGLAPDEPELFHLFTTLSLLLSTASVVIGGWPFFRAAWRGLREGVLHLDVPIALGIALVYATSLLQAFQARGDLAYFDTLNTFITLMLFGRWMQRRIVERNKSYLLDDAGLEGLVCRRLESNAVRVVPAAAVRQGDALLIAPGELVPVDATLSGERGGQISLDWISGESAPQPLVRGARVPAGSFNAGASPLQLTALGKMDGSSLPSLLRTRQSARVADAFWNKLARGWATRVLIVAGLGFVLWLPFGLSRALDVAVALLVVTCPCAIGLSIPLAYELVQARLRRRGFYARDEDLLDRLRRVRKVLFDKTGTLTLSQLELTSIPALTEAQRHIAFNLASRSAHPASACIARALSGRWDDALVTREVPGVGIESGPWLLGRSEPTREAGGSPIPAPRGAGERTDGATTLYFDGHPTARFPMREKLRPGALEQMKTLKDDGYALWLVSGDSKARVAGLALRLGLGSDHVLAAQSPEDKARLVAGVDAQDTLFLGDGVNDAPAFAKALCAGTPAIDRPVMPSRSSFFFVGEGLSALSEALSLSRRLHQVVRSILFVSLAYNIVAVTAGLAGFITPLRAAVFMPLSSLSLLLFTLWALREKRAPAPALVEVPA
jgi:Cu2+-exporting ATPase